MSSRWTAASCRMLDLRLPVRWCRRQAGCGCVRAIVPGSATVSAPSPDRASAWSAPEFDPFPHPDARANRAGQKLSCRRRRRSCPERETVIVAVQSAAIVRCRTETLRCIISGEDADLGIFAVRLLRDDVVQTQRSLRVVKRLVTTCLARDAATRERMGVRPESLFRTTGRLCQIARRGSEVSARRLYPRPQPRGHAGREVQGRGSVAAILGAMSGKQHRVSSDLQHLAVAKARPRVVVAGDEIDLSDHCARRVAIGSSVPDRVRTGEVDHVMQGQGRLRVVEAGLLPSSRWWPLGCALPDSRPAAGLLIDARRNGRRSAKDAGLDRTTRNPASEPRHILPNMMHIPRKVCEGSLISL